MRFDEGSMRASPSAQCDWQDIRLSSPPPPEAPSRPVDAGAPDDEGGNEHNDSPAASTAVAELEQALQNLRLRRHFCKDQIEQLSNRPGSPEARGRATGEASSGAIDATDPSDSRRDSGRESGLSEGDADEEGYVPFTM